MKLINRLAFDSINVNKERGQIFIKLSIKEIYFSMGCVRAFGLVHKGYIQFIEEDGEWYFIHGNDQTGFMLSKKSDYGLRVCNKRLVAYFIEQAHIKNLPVMLKLEKEAGKEYGGLQMVKINTKNPKIVL